MQANTLLCLHMSKWQFNMENLNIIPIIRTNYDSSVEVRVLCKEGHEGVRGELVSDWTKMQDGRWKAAFWLDNNSKMATRPVIGQEFKMANGKAAIWLDNNSRWWMEQDQTE